MAALAFQPLRRLAALAPSTKLKRAWDVLIAALILCLAFRATAAVVRLQDKVDTSDLLDAVVHLIGPAFVLGIAWLTQHTAREALRVSALERIAFVDPVTGLANRRRFDSCLQEQICGALRFDRPLQLVLFDLDGFKQVNDRFGHAAGDALLKQVGGLIGALARPADLACRIGGDEFALISEGEDVVSAVECFWCQLQDASVLETSFDARVTVSIGSAALRPDDTAAKLLKRADDALYTAKRDGRNRIAWAA